MSIANAALKGTSKTQVLGLGLFNLAKGLTIKKKKNNRKIDEFCSISEKSMKLFRNIVDSMFNIIINNIIIVIFIFGK